MMRVLFIGDVVGEPGLAFLEEWLPQTKEAIQPDFIVANGENLSLHGRGAGLDEKALARLLALGVDAVTTGNHAFDGPWEVLNHPKLLRPLNWGLETPGKGALILSKDKKQLRVVNVISRTAWPHALDPLEALERYLKKEGEMPTLVDYHGESVFEKLGVAFLLDGRIAALLGTHTHVPTLDTRILPKGTAYVSDVGMVGAGGGMQGYRPDGLIDSLLTRLPPRAPLRWAEGPVELGAVILDINGNQARSIRRL